MKKMVGLALAALMLVGCSSGGGGGSAETVKCSGTMQGLDATVNLEFDGDEKLTGLEMIMSMDMGNEEGASQLEGQESYFAEALGVDESTVDIKADGSEIEITIDMNRSQMQDSDLFGDVDLDASKEEMIKSMEDDAGLTCQE